MTRKQEYINEYRAEQYDRIEIIMPKGSKARVKAIAAAGGMSTSEYISALIAADTDAHGGSRIARKRELTPDAAQLLNKWEVPHKYFAMIEGVDVATDAERAAAAAAGKRVACCEYVIYIKAGYVNDITGGRVIRTDKTKEIRRIITHTHAIK